MSPKLKSILLIVLTLAIGYAAGFISHSVIRQNRFEQMRSRMGKSEGFVQYLKRVMEVNPDQEASIQPILELYAPRIHEHNRQFKHEVRIMIDSLSLELSPHLEEEQLQKLKKRFSRRRPRPKQ